MVCDRGLGDPAKATGQLPISYPELGYEIGNCPVAFDFPAFIILCYWQVYFGKVIYSKFSLQLQKLLKSYAFNMPTQLN